MSSADSVWGTQQLPSQAWGGGGRGGSSSAYLLTSHICHLCRLLGSNNTIFTLLQVFVV